MITTTADSLQTTEPAALRAWVEKRNRILELTDGRILGFPADRFRILQQATNEQLQGVTLELGGFALAGWNSTRTLPCPALLPVGFKCRRRRIPDLRNYGAGQPKSLR